MQVKGSPQVSKSGVKTARLVYEILSSKISRKNFSADQRIKKSFTDSFRLLGSDSVYVSGESNVDIEWLKKTFDGILVYLSKEVPGL